ncbi:unnamed protein product [Caenorhabditis auriculariae]|uniref:G protein-coupled receptor n=1 Tax=Caenorhabditis auriculariae TaxID=2777116 RepID=A0A8S1H385_9PELO|nr:unnamed protein product [Caenorhabditis auriculariae]
MYLISTKSNKHLGNYKYLMLVFTVQATVFAASDAVNQPTLHVYKGTVVVFGGNPFALSFKFAFLMNVIICGTAVARKIKVKSPSMSHRTHDMHRQLFRALVVQTAIPFVLMYIPGCLELTVPFFEIELGYIENMIVIFYTLYPILDPLAVIYLIKDYRMAVSRIFTSKVHHNVPSVRVTISDCFKYLLNGEAVYSLVLTTCPHHFPILAVTPGLNGQRLWTITSADD